MRESRACSFAHMKMIELDVKYLPESPILKIPMLLLSPLVLVWAWETAHSLKPSFKEEEVMEWVVKWINKEK